MTSTERQTGREALNAALNEKITTETLAGAELVSGPRRAKIVYSARIDPRYSDRLAAEATRCGQNPSQLIADLVVEALQAREAELGQNVMVNLADIHRAINAAARQPPC